MGAAYSFRRRARRRALRSAPFATCPARALLVAPHMHGGLHFGLRQRPPIAFRAFGRSLVFLVVFVVGARALAVVRAETNGRVDLELHRGEELLHLAREVRMLEEIAHLLRD